MAKISHKLLAKHGVDVDPKTVVKGVTFFERTDEGVGERLGYANNGKQFEKMVSRHPRSHRIPDTQ